MPQPKADARTQVRMLEKLLPQEYIDEADRAIVQKFLNSEEYKNAERIFAYYAVGRETPTQEIIRKALSDGKRVALPVSHPKGIMEFREIHDLVHLKPGRYGIPEPDESCRPMDCRDGDLVIVPALSCDKNGNRLGRGAGYYDRFLACRDCLSVCLMRTKLMRDDIPMEAHDQRVKIVINEKGGS